jgi:signal transduction histidine kinase
VRLLLSQALAATPPSAGPVTLRTGRGGEHVRLTVEDGGPSVPPEVLPHLFEPFITPRHGPSNLELAVCKMLVRRLQGRLEAVNRPGGGVAFLADLPVHTAASPAAG